MKKVDAVFDPRARARFDAAREWLVARPRGEGVLVIGETLPAARDLLLSAVARTGGALGWRRTTLGGLALELAGPALAAEGLAPGGEGVRDAVVARTLFGAGPRERGEAVDRPADGGRFAPVADTPGFVRALGRSTEDLRMAGVTAEELVAADPDLARLAEAVATEWRAAGLADRARTFRAAIEAVESPAFRHPWLGSAVLLLDPGLRTPLEARLAAALLIRADAALLTLPVRDELSRRRLVAAGIELAPELDRAAGIELAPELDRAREGATPPTEAAAPSALARLQRHLFADPPPEAPPDPSLVVFSAPGEGRECVEIARRLLDAARDAVPFDRCAILLRQPEDYRPYLEDALDRAGIPAFHAGGARRPDPSGRAFLALLRCRAEGFSARRFAEYLSLGQVPRSDGEDAETPVPRRWERLLVEASVVGGWDRWDRRLRGLSEELAVRAEGAGDEDPDDPRRARLARDRAELEAFRRFALPLLGRLAALPDGADWRAWLESLRDLAGAALRDPARVAAVLGELAPMGPVGPVDLDGVVRALAPRLLEVRAAPEPDRFGKVFVGPVDAARGLRFDTVFVPGLAERGFPPKIAEDPILLDEVRQATGGDRLPTNDERVAAERLALAVAVGAAERAVVLSYPRIEAVKARPRVPSFYALEALRAAEGRLPAFEDLAERAERVSEARIGWPAPRRAREAIDEAEYDLAVLHDLGLRGEAAVRAAGHLLHANPHLARSLRFRAYRWGVTGWTWADGLVFDRTLGPDTPAGKAAREALARHGPGSRPYSATALQHFAACPYRFYLYTIQRLAPREEPAGIETLDPLQRGSLVHEVQFRLLTRLQTESTTARPLLPVRPETLDTAWTALDETLAAVAEDFRDRLVPAIERVWDDGIESIRQDLREWLYRESQSSEPWIPWRFELSFGLPPDPHRDVRSVPDPADLGVGLSLRGAIDLVERAPDGRLRVTDHKTGRYRARRDALIQGGELLQPVLYALAAQALFPEDRVVSGRLYYCTSDGDYRSHEVPLGPDTIGAASAVAEVLGEAFGGGRFPALPREGACRWCDYRTLCGPDEERRARRKPAPTDLQRLREMR